MACTRHEPYRPVCPNCGRENVEWMALLEQRDRLEETCRFYAEQIQHGNLRPRADEVRGVREAFKRLRRARARR